MTADARYPIDIDVPVTVLGIRFTPAGEVAVISLPFGLANERSVDTFEVFGNQLLIDDDQSG